MPWVCAKIKGDGRTTETAFRTVYAETGGCRVVASSAPRDKQGKPFVPFELEYLHDDDASKINGSPECFVFPLMRPDEPVGLDIKQQIANGLLQQGCIVDLSAVTTFGTALATAQMEVIKTQPPGDASLDFRAVIL